MCMDIVRNGDVYEENGDKSDLLISILHPAAIYGPPSASLRRRNKTQDDNNTVVSRHFAQVRNAWDDGCRLGQDEEVKAPAPPSGHNRDNQV
ncbi:uncharacterized protein UV8b_02505 [Ustilaginoidea virens]|nr:uncharacterized protein UV8b_02505 [Ustilaginoidea virens]QUC18264.1 hypothetical protein UV8b_02505 [Ustilaginoidea virens]